MSAYARAATSDLTGGAGAGGLSGLGFNDAPIMLGDQGPASVRTLFTPTIPTPPPVPTPGRPPTPPIPRPQNNKVRIAAPWARGFKISDNQSPRPQDRVFFTFNYFNNFNQSINQRLGAPFSSMQVYRYILGLEKTFWDGWASIGIRMPINTISATSTVRGLGGTSTAINNFTVFSKMILWQDPTVNNRLISAGLSVTAPSGPGSFAGAPYAFGLRDTQIQPFLGYIWGQDRFYIQGFESIDIPTSSADVTMLYNDIGIGYFVYQDNDPNALIRAIVPTFETHINVPLNHVGAFRANDPFGTPDVVDLTFGGNVLLGRSTLLSVAFVDPVTGPRPFNFEWVVLLNVYFGRTRQNPAIPTPPVIGQ
jgi:hypothetical protein